NIISGNTQRGVRIQNVGTSFNVVAGNYIGLDAGGTLDRGNTLDGVILLTSTTSNTIGVGGPTTDASPLATIHVDPASTFLRTLGSGSDPGVQDATPVSLASLGLAPGDVIRLQRLGDWSFGLGVDETINTMDAVFSSSSTLNAFSNQFRVPGAI